MTESFQSNFVFGLQGKSYDNFINRIATSIIEKVIGTDDYEIISFEGHLSHKDFKNTKGIVSHIYTTFLNDIKKENNKVSFKKKVCITLDESLCIDTCPNTGRKITTIKLAGADLAYFIYFDVKEFFDFVYDDEFVDTYKSNIQNIQINQSKKEIQPINNQELITRIGYIHNSNIEKKLSFIHDSKDGNDGFALFYQKYPEIEDLPVGTVIKARGYFYSDKFYVENYEIGEFDDLPFQLIKLKGTLKCQYGKFNNKIATILTNLGTVFVPSNLIQDYEMNKIYNVNCLAIEHYNEKKGENGWKAITISKIDELS